MTSDVYGVSQEQDLHRAASRKNTILRRFSENKGLRPLSVTRWHPGCISPALDGEFAGVNETNPTSFTQM